MTWTLAPPLLDNCPCSGSSARDLCSECCCCCCWLLDSVLLDFAMWSLWYSSSTALGTVLLGCSLAATLARTTRNTSSRTDLVVQTFSLQSITPAMAATQGTLPPQMFLTFTNVQMTTISDRGVFLFFLNNLHNLSLKNSLVGHSCKNTAPFSCSCWVMASALRLTKADMSMCQFSKQQQQTQDAQPSSRTPLVEPCDDLWHLPNFCIPHSTTQVLSKRRHPEQELAPALTALNNPWPSSWFRHAGLVMPTCSRCNTKILIKDSPLRQCY